MKKCNRCNTKVEIEKDLDYPYYCPECDENMYDFETYDNTYIELSPEVSQICKENYNTNCGNCPLRPACVSKITARGQEDLNREVTTINELAEQLTN